MLKLKVQRRKEKVIDEKEKKEENWKWIKKKQMGLKGEDGKENEWKKLKTVHRWRGKLNRLLWQ